MNRFLIPAAVLALCCCAVTTAPAAEQVAGRTREEWREFTPGVWKYASSAWPSAGRSRGYVVVDGKEALAVGAPADIDLATLEQKLGCRVDTILLTHAHRDSTAAAARLIEEKRTVRAPKLSEPWLSPAGVEKYWADSVVTPIDDPPLKHRRWAQWYYFVPAQGLGGVHFDIADHDVVRCGKWTVKAVATPGHSPDHMSYAATYAGRPDRIVFCGDAYCSDGLLFSPFTTEWHHQQSDGLLAAADSLRRIAALQPTWLCPEHNNPNSVGPDLRLSNTARIVRHVATMKGFDTWLQPRIPKLSKPKFLAANQVGSANADGNLKPWTKLSPHLYLSGNTYAIASRDGPVLLVDPYHRALPTKLQELKRDHGVGPVEAMTISHAHNDHYTGVFAFPSAERPPVWALDRIADVIENPDRFRAPYVDPRPVKIARRLADGEEISWREYKLKFHHLPGQTEFAMGLELEIDGKKVLFTGDNFYRADQYSGSGGWSGHNRGLPGGYARSIRKVISLKPDWILAEHGGAMEYSEADFEARLSWASEALGAADVLSLASNHRREWNPHLVAIEPVIVRAKPGDIVGAVISVDETLERVGGELMPPEQPGNLTLRPAGNNILGIKQFEAVRNQRKIGLRILPDAPAGRHVIPFEVLLGETPLAIDLVIVVEIEKK